MLTLVFASAPECDSRHTYNNKKNQIKKPKNLPQTDRASTFVVDSMKIFLPSGLTIMQNFVVSHTVCAYVRGPKIRGRWSSAS